MPQRSRLASGAFVGACQSQSRSRENSSALPRSRKDGFPGQQWTCVGMTEMNEVPTCVRMTYGYASEGVRPPIYAVSASVLPEERQRCLNAGMDGHIAKPVALAQLRALLEPIST